MKPTIIEKSWDEARHPEQFKPGRKWSRKFARLRHRTLAAEAVAACYEKRFP